MVLAKMFLVSDDICQIYRVEKKMSFVQELSEEFLWNLTYRLTFEIEIRYMVHGGPNDPWEQPMYLIPMWNIVEKIKAFKRYFDEFNVIFPTEDVYRHPIDLSEVFPPEMIKVKEEEFLYKGEKIIVTYNYV